MAFRKLRFYLGAMGALLLLLSSCSGEKAMENLNQTRTAVAGDIYSTQTAIPPTRTATFTSSPTVTHTITQTPTLADTPTPAPSSTPTLTPLPVSISDWENSSLSSICLEVSQVFPQFDEDPAYQSPDLPVTEFLEDVLADLQIKVSDEDCEAKIIISLEGTNRSDTYTVNGSSKECFTKASVSGTLQLVPLSGDWEVIESTFRGSYSPFLINSCPSEITTSVNWGEAWIPSLSNKLIQIWGAPASLALLEAKYSAAREAGMNSLSGSEAVRALPVLLSWISGEVQAGIAYVDIARALGRIGPQAMPAVPYLIEYYEAESSGMAGQAYEYRNALEKITGLEENDDPGFWSSWWEMYTNQDAAQICQTLLNDTDAGARRAAAETLGTVQAGEHEQLIIESLTAAVLDANGEVRMAAMNSLVRFGPRAEPALPNLMSRLEISELDSSEKYQVMDTMTAIGIESVPPLVYFVSQTIENYAHVSTSQKSAFSLLLKITGLSFDEDTVFDAKMDWRLEMGRVLAESMDLYRAETGK